MDFSVITWPNGRTSQKIPPMDLGRGLLFGNYRVTVIIIICSNLVSLNVSVKNLFFLSTIEQDFSLLSMNLLLLAALIVVKCQRPFFGKKHAVRSRLFLQ